VLNTVFAACPIGGRDPADPLAPEFLANFGHILFAIKALTATFARARRRCPGAAAMTRVAPARVSRRLQRTVRAARQRRRTSLIFVLRNPARTKTAARF